MENQQQPRTMPERLSAFGWRAVAIALFPAVVICLLGVALLMLALTQDAWVSGRIGPGLFAQWLSIGVIGLSLVWAAWSLAELYRLTQPTEKDSADAVRLEGRIEQGLALLAAVCLFALSLPHVGLVFACAMTAVVAGWGAGDRGIFALGVSALLGGSVALGIGLTLLPPTIKLWPWGPF